MSESHSVMSDSLQPHGLYSPWNSPDQNIRVSSFSLLQGIFSTQGWNPSLLHPGRFFTSWAIRKNTGKPKNTGVGSLSLLQGIFLTQGSNWGLLHCRWILYHLSYQGSSYTYTIVFTCAKLLQSCWTFCDPVDSSPPGSSVHGIL